jgi:putative FmdB family regulatory protein
MPTYDYVCKECEHSFEHFQSMTSDLLQDCPECEQPALKRLFGSGAALIFKGSGFYCTDYKKPAAKPSGADLDKKVERTKEASKAVKESSGSASSGTGSDSSGSSKSESAA